MAVETTEWTIKELYAQTRRSTTRQKTILGVKLSIVVAVMVLGQI